MRYPAHETAERHQRILEEASRLFRAKGFAAASIGDVMKACGLTHGGFYAHFDSKDALARASLDYAMERKLEDVRRLTSGGENSKADFLTSYLSMSHRNHPEDGCAVAALAADVAREPSTRPNFTSRLKTMIATFEQHLPWNKSRSKERQAMYFTAAIVGALVLARAVDDPEISEQILLSVREELLAE